MDTFAILARQASAPAKTPAEQFLELVSDPFRSQLQGTAFLSSLITSLVATTAIALLFCFLRPYNSVVYAPRLRHADEKHAPPTLGKSPWAWVPAIMKTNEDTLVEKLGMDAAIFLRFTRMSRAMFLTLTVIGCGILIPTYLVGGRQYGSQAGISAFMRLTPQYLIGQTFWGIVACSWLINIVVLGYLWWNYRAVARLRRKYFGSPEYQRSLHARTLIVTDLPKSVTNDEGVVHLVDDTQQSSVIPKGHIGRKVKELPELIEEHEETVKQLESVLAKYLKNPDKLPPNRPMCKASKRDKKMGQGEKVDAIEYLTQRIQDLEKEIKEVRNSLDKRSAESYGFASYDSVEDAHGVAFAAKGKHPQGSTIALAPRPSDIIWKNLPLSKAARKSRAITNNMWIGLLTFIWFVPNALIAVFLANLGNLGLIWPAFDVELKRHDKGWAVVQGVLAPALSSLIYWALPHIFRQLSIKAGDTSKTARDRHVMSKLFAFFVFNNLVMFSLFGCLFSFAASIAAARQKGQTVLDAVKNGDIFTKIMLALCSVSPYWASWLLQRNLGAAIDLAQLVNLAWGSILRRFSSPTPRRLIELSAPPPFDYASYYNYFLFYAAVTLCFAPIQPIVLPITAMYFCIDSWLKKYLLMYVFTTKTESGGRFWRPIFNRMLVGLVMSDVIVALLVFARRGSMGYHWIAMLGVMAPLPVIIVLFKMYCKRSFDTDLEFYMVGKIKGDDTATIDDDKSRRSDRVSLRFGHPALYKPLMTPMVNAKAQHMLNKVYNGRLDDDDMDDVASMAGYSDTYSMHNIARNHQRKISRQHKGPFEFVNENEMDFENFKNREDFKHEHGGDGEMIGKPEDLSRTGTPVGGPVSRAGTFPIRPGLPLRESERSLSGTTYPQGYAPPQYPSNLRDQSPGPLLGDAAPMGAATPNLSRTATDTSFHFKR